MYSELMRTELVDDDTEDLDEPEEEDLEEDPE